MSEEKKDEEKKESAPSSTPGKKYDGGPIPKVSKSN